VGGSGNGLKEDYSVGTEENHRKPLSQDTRFSSGY
jgi:hypothetical protein